ncbi:MAG: DUF4198 domain-containing protein [Pseudomonadota bacterium]
MDIFRKFVLSCSAAAFATTATAHEFWISPESYVIESGGQVQAHLRVGQNFKGSSYAFRDSQFERFELITGDNVTQVTGRLGDTPALSMGAPDTGLMVVVHETTDNTLNYREWEKFVAFVEHKAFPTTLEDHAVRGLPEENFVELYRRYAKSLVAVGSGAGADTRVGLKTEIVALANPYTDQVSDFPVQVFLDGEPRVDAQLEVFDKAPDGSVQVTLHRTDADGKASVPVIAGHEYLFDAVAMVPLPNNEATKGPVWWSLWAALTFKVPAKN